MKCAAAAIATLLLVAGCDAGTPGQAATRPAGPQPQSLATTVLALGNRTFTLQIAGDNAARETGLMYVRSMPADRGMIFLFTVERVQEFWMHNTPIDLDIVYIDHAGKIVAVRTMHAFDESSVSSDDPADVAIELNAGVAKAAGLAAGDIAVIPPELRGKAR